MNTLSELSDAHFDRLRARFYSEATIRSQRCHVRQFIRYLSTTFEVTVPEQLTRHHMARFQLHVKDHRNAKGKPCTPHTINGWLKAVRNFLRFLYKEGYTTRDLAGDLESVRLPKRLPVVFGHEEYLALVERIDTSRPQGFRNRTVIELLYSSAIRRGELLGLTLTDLDLKERTLLVTGKGKKERLVPFGQTAKHYLETYLLAVRPFWRGAKDCDAVFLNHLGKPLTANSVARMVAMAFADASVHVTPHTFRRSCATELIRGGAKHYHVKDFLGHETLHSLSAYTRLTLGDVKETHARYHPREREAGS